MNDLSYLKKSVYSAVVFFGTIVTLSTGYGALLGWLSSADKVGTGSWLTSASWNRIIDGVLDLDTKMSNFSFSGGSVGIGVIPSTTLEVAGTVKAANFQGYLNNLKMYSWINSFPNASCDSINNPCVINISPGWFLHAPICTITMGNMDGTVYTENMVIKSITSTSLNLWKGNYQNEGTSMVVYWICIWN